MISKICTTVSKKERGGKVVPVLNYESYSKKVASSELLKK
jgi:hypothetical protein